MRALVIGGTGPTGVCIVEGLLERGYQVSIYHTGAHEVSFSAPVAHLHGNPRDRSCLERDLAPLSFDLAISTYGRLRHIEQVLRGRVGKLVAITGGPVYRDFRRRGSLGLPLPIPEDAPVYQDPEEDLHGYLIALGEREVMEAHQQGHYRASIVRYPKVYGPREDNPFEWSVIRRVLDGRTHIIAPADGLYLRQRGYVENVAHLVLLAATRPEADGHIYNAGDERSLTLRAWIALIARTMGSSLEIVELPLAAVPFLDPDYSNGAGYKSYAGHHSTLFDFSRARIDLGYRDPVPLDEAMRRTVEWLLAQRPAPGDAAERKIGDRFDYALEDRVIASYRGWLTDVAQLWPEELRDAQGGEGRR